MALEQPDFEHLVKGLQHQPESAPFADEKVFQDELLSFGRLLVLLDARAAASDRLTDSIRVFRPWSAEALAGILHKSEHLAARMGDVLSISRSLGSAIASVRSRSNFALMSMPPRWVFEVVASECRAIRPGLRELLQLVVSPFEGQVRTDARHQFGMVGRAW